MMSREIRYTLHMFYEDIEQGSYIDAIECLNELYYYKLHETDERNRINAALVAHKNGIVKRLLRYMKNYSSDEVAHFVPLTINALRAFDINWPDLDVIASSVTDGTPVTEALSSPLGGIVMAMQDALRKDNGAAVSHRVIDLWRGTLAERQRASDMLADVKNLVISYVERHLKSEYHLDVQDGLNMLQVLPPSSEWSELQHLLTKYKKPVVKYLMKCMLDGDYDIVEYRVPKLHEWGITWPDLDVLKTSADDELKRKTASSRYLDEADSRADFSTVFRNRSEEEGGHRFLLNADEYVDHIRNLLQSGHGNDQTTVELATIGRRRRDAIKDWPELAAVINEYKTQLLRIIAWHFNRENFVSHSAARSIDVASALNDIGVHWPEITPLIEKNKRKIVTTLLEMIKDDFDSAVIAHEIRALKTYGAKWPELDIISDSITPDELTENDTGTAVWPDDIRSMLMDMLKRDNLGIALYHIEQFGINIENMPEVEAFLTKNKREYVKIMLRDLKDGREWKYGAVDQYLGRLEKAKVKWPELSIIRDSLNTIQNSEEDNNDN